MKKWQDEVLHSERFKWASKTLGRSHYCRNVMSNTIDDKNFENFEDDDDGYMDIRKDEDKFAFLIPYYNYFLEMITSDVAAMIYIFLIIIGIVYLCYYLVVNHQILSRTKSGYSLVT